MKTARFIWLSPSMAREMLERDARLPEINRAIGQCQWRLKRGVFPRVPVAPIT